MGLLDAYNSALLPQSVPPLMFSQTSDEDDVSAARSWMNFNEEHYVIMLLYNQLIKTLQTYNQYNKLR